MFQMTQVKVYRDGIIRYVTDDIDTCITTRYIADDIDGIIRYVTDDIAWYNKVCYS